MLSEGSWWFGYSRDMNPFIPLSIDPKNILTFQSTEGYDF